MRKIDLIDLIDLISKKYAMIQAPNKSNIGEKTENGQINLIDLIDLISKKYPMTSHKIDLINLISPPATTCRRACRAGKKYPIKQLLNKFNLGEIK